MPSVDEIRKVSKSRKHAWRQISCQSDGRAPAGSSMETTESLSKGCFVFKNGFKAKSNKNETEDTALFEQQFIKEPWYISFTSTWERVEKRLNHLNKLTYDGVLHDLVNYIDSCFDHDDLLLYAGIIPSAMLLLGINQPDHRNVFVSLKSQLESKVTPHVAILQSQECTSVKQTVEAMIFQFINGEIDLTHDEPILKKNNCNLRALTSWFDDKYSEKKNHQKSSPKKIKRSKLKQHLVVVISDFESFNSEVLQDFILILSSYMPELPFILIFGVATSVSALDRSFPHKVSSKLDVQIFQSHSSTAYLNQVLDEVFLIRACPFQVSGKIFQLIVDVFLFYDFSVSGFIQNMKFCMMEHYFSSKLSALCCNVKDIDSIVDSMDNKMIEGIRHLPSFRPYVESSSPSEKIALLTNDDHLRTELKMNLKEFHGYLRVFYKHLHILLIFVQNLPNSPLGKQIRELYPICVTSEIVSTPEFNQCLLLLNFLSKNELIDLVNKSLAILEKYSKPKSNSCHKQLNEVYVDFCNYKEKLNSASMEIKIIDVEENEDEQKMDRHSFKRSLIKASQKERGQSEYDEVKHNFTNYLAEIFKKNLQPPSTRVFHELFVFEDIYNIKKHIIGAPRASVHIALNNPAAYLQCDCCETSNQESILSTMPDLAIAYKLHLECGKLINLYDWLQAFLTIVDPIENDNSDEERREVNPKIQARFTRAVAELQFLGFIKSSKRKTDHVTRLTW